MAPLNHLAELLARIAFVAGNMLLGKIVNACRDGTAQRIFSKPNASLPMRRRMSPDEAKQILGLTSSTFHSQEIIKRAQRLYEINAANDRFPGSPYLQRKATIAQSILEEQLRTTQQKTPPSS